MPNTIAHEIAACKKLGVNVVIKIVRGAYIAEENKLAKENAYESPIWPSI